MTAIARLISANILAKPVEVGRMALLSCLIFLPNLSGASSLPKQSRVRRDQARALLISDIHFDPFQDPAKVPELANSPISHWSTILNSPRSDDQAVAFARVRDACGKDVFDTSASLLSDTFNAVRAKARDLNFAVLTGDLIAHDFYCRYNATMPNRSAEEARRFLIRTIEFEVDGLRQAILPSPLYVALGNNDSLCGDYRLDAQDPLFHELLPTIARAAHVRGSTLIEGGFEQSGHLYLPLPKPMRRARIIILDDLPFSNRFSTCDGRRSDALAVKDSSWLQSRLSAAREGRERVVFAAHIPPGIDPRPTLLAKDVCAQRFPIMFLSSNALPDVLTENSDVISFALFAHTHMDELRLLRSPRDDLRGVPVKLIPSISPVAGNRPSFLIAQIDPSTAALLDYEQYTAPDPEIRHASWIPVYSFRKGYETSDFTAKSLNALIARVRSKTSQGSKSIAEYVERYSTGSSQYRIDSVWKQYQCLIDHTEAQQFLDCACPSAKVHTEDTK